MNNTVLRTISGTGFIILMLAGLLVNKFLYAGLVLFIMVVMMHEFYTITMRDRENFGYVSIGNVVRADFSCMRVRSPCKICEYCHSSSYGGDGEFALCEG